MKLPISAKSTIASNCSRTSLRESPSSEALMQTFSAPVRSGWKPAPRSSSGAMRYPFTSTLPRSGWQSRVVRFSRVLFPAPLCPMTATLSPCWMRNEMSLSAWNFSGRCDWNICRSRSRSRICPAWRSNDFQTPSNWMAGYLSDMFIKLRFHSAEGQQADQENGKGGQHQFPHGVGRAIGRHPLVHDAAHYNHQRCQRVHLVNVAVLLGDEAERIEDRHQPQHHQIGGFDDVACIAHEHIKRGRQQRQAGDKHDFESPHYRQPEPIPIDGNLRADGPHKQKQELHQQVDATGEHCRDRHYLARNEEHTSELQ